MAVIGRPGLTWAFGNPFFLGMDVEDSFDPNNDSMHLNVKIVNGQIQMSGIYGRNQLL